MRQPPVNDSHGWPAQWNPGRRHRVPPISPVTEKLVRRTAFTGSGWIVFIFCGIPGLYLLNIARLFVGEWGGAFFTALIIGLLLLLPVAVAASRRTQFDADGIHVRGLWARMMPRGPAPAAGWSSSGRLRTRSWDSSSWPSPGSSS